VWRGGDVKDPGPFCKQCYHKNVSPGRNPRRREASVEPEIDPSFDPIWCHLEEEWWRYEVYESPEAGIPIGQPLREREDDPDPFDENLDLDLPFKSMPGDGADDIPF
jgi:hypothetical protein